jgi:hypothetical protein
MPAKNSETPRLSALDITERLTRGIEMLRTGKTPTVGELLEEGKAALADAERALEAATKDRDLAMGRWEQRLERRKAALEQLRIDLAKLEKQIVSQETANKSAKEKKGASEKKG